MNYKILKKDMNLIQIYKKGELETVKYYYENQERIGERWMFLIKHFLAYFPEATEGLSTTKELIEKRKDIYNDQYLDEFRDLFEMIGHGPKNPRTGRKRMRPDMITDEIGQKFYDEFFGRTLKIISIKTTKEEALASGIKEVVEVRKLHDDYVDKQFQKQNERFDTMRSKVAEETTKEDRDNSYDGASNTFDIMNKLEKIAKNHNVSIEKLVEMSGLEIDKGYRNDLFSLAKSIFKICNGTSDDILSLTFGIHKDEEVKRNNFQILLNICNAFDVPVDYFFFKSEV